MHAPALGHLVDLVRLVPSDAPLTAHPSLAEALGHAHFGVHYLAAVALGCSVFAIVNAARWTVHARSKWVRFSSSLAFFIFLLPAFTSFFAPGVTAAIFLVPRGHARSLASIPSSGNIASHFALAAVVLYGCWRIAREAEV